MSKVMVIAPHPDDETLGCGGTLLKHKNAGDEIHWLIMTAISEEQGFQKEMVESRCREIDSVVNAYGFNSVSRLNFPSAMLDVIPKKEAVQAISNAIKSSRPEIIYIPYRNDVHSDHRATFDSVYSSAKSFRAPFIKKILMYEVLSETEFAPAIQSSVFVPNCYSDITEYLEKKLSILRMYNGETGVHPFPRSAENLKALATFRGATAGVQYAEAFMILKETW